jgi:hypothetical protein
MPYWIKYTPVFVICMLSACAQQTIKPFNTDGCSVFPDGTGEHKALWQECCTAHDLAYWQGGSYQQRLQADRQLQQCVTKVGQKDIARLMLAGVRVGGTPVLPTSFRWGYGWPYPRGYREPDHSERQQIEAQLLRLPIEQRRSLTKH